MESPFSSVDRIFWIFLMMTLLPGGCAGALPGGNDTINQSFYASAQDLEKLASQLQPGMTRSEVFTHLGRTEKDFKHLSREEVVSALFGGKNGGLPTAFSTPEGPIAFLQSLDGYKLEYKSIKRRHGFVSPIRIRTDKIGFDYCINLIFKEDTLFEKPILTGGVVSAADSKTLFDYLNPGLAVNQMQ